MFLTTTGCNYVCINLEPLLSWLERDHFPINLDIYKLQMVATYVAMYLIDGCIEDDHKTVIDTDSSNKIDASEIPPHRFALKKIVVSSN